MKVLLISANKEMLPDPVAPLGVACLASALLERGHEVAVADLCFAPDCKKVLADMMADFSPDIIGISVRNIDNVAFPNSISYLPFYKDVVSYCKAYSGAPVVAGGAGFTLMPIHMLSYINADYGIIGEGEEALPSLITEISKGRQHIDLPGVITRHSKPSAGHAAPSFIDLDSLAFPRRELLDNSAYMKHGGMGNIQTRRGCAGRCIYCTYPLIEGRSVRLRSPQRVVDEIEHMKKEMGIDTFFAVDTIFNFPPEYAKVICRELIKRNLMVRWSCYCSPAFTEDGLLLLMREAGCTGVEFGTDNCSDYILKNLQKGFTVKDILQASRACKEAGMAFCHSLLLGSPGETGETVAETLSIMEDIDPTAVVIMTGIRIFPGTQLARIAEAEGVIPERDISLSPVFYVSSAVKPFIIDIVREYAQRHSNCIVPGQNIMSDYAIQKRLRHYGIQGPLWEHMKIRQRKGEPHRNEGINY